MTLRLAMVLSLCAAPAMALTPPPPCDGVIESDMMVGGIRTLGSEWSGTSGVTVETYRNAVMLSGETWVSRPAPLPQLEGIDGTRVLHCASGDFLVIDDVDPDRANAALSATEFLRGRLQAGQPVSFADLRRAAEAVYGRVTVLRETDQTCACGVFYEGHVPPGGRPFAARPDVEF